MARKKLTAEESLRIMEECAQGLTYSHARGLTHRDIKPTNILIGVASGQAKLVDFGLAEISENSSMQLQRQEDKDDDVAVDRTVDYAGLEKATGVKPGDVRSDIYFLGSVLYECLTGATLMTVTKDRQVRMQARRYQDVEDTLHKNGPALGVPPSLMRLLGKMVAYDPGRAVPDADATGGGDPGVPRRSVRRAAAVAARRPARRRCSWWSRTRNSRTRSARSSRSTATGCSCRSTPARR